MERVTFLKPFGSPQAPHIFFFCYRRRMRRQMGADGAAPPEDKENPAEGGCFVSI